MARTGGKKGMPHLFSGLVASSLATAVLFAGRMVAIHLEHTTLPSTAPELFPLKNQGLAFQRAAVHTPNVLPLYGTSELITPSVPERASLFFAVRQQVFKSRPLVVEARTYWSCCKKSAHSARTCEAKNSSSRFHPVGS
jgi:hypothetical protein